MKKFLQITLILCVFAVCAFACMSAQAYELPEGAQWVSVVDDECEHEFYKSYSTNATCIYDGEEHYYCMYCGSEYYIVTQPKLNHSFTKSITKAVYGKSDGSITTSCSRCGYQTYKTIPYANQIKLSTTSYTYNGSAKRPIITVLDREGNTVSKSYYTVTYSNNVKAGKACAKIVFKGNYSGTVNKYYKIKPTPTTLSSVKYKTTGKANVVWKKNTTGTGYVIQYSTSSKFAKRNTCNIFVTDAKTTSKVLSSLPSKTYYVRIATYKSLGKEKYISKWSSSKKVTIKKGVSLKTMINATKTDLTGRNDILALTNNAVDIKKYSTTYDRFRAIYVWHSKNGLKFANCMECNMNFNDCLFCLYQGHKAYDQFIWLAAGSFKNSNGSVVIHKWSVISIQGVPLIFDPRLQSYTKNYTGTDYFGISSSSRIGKKYLFDGWMFYWQDTDYKLS